MNWNWSMVSYGILMIFLGIVSFYDIKSLRIPNKTLIVGGTLGLVLLSLNDQLSTASVLLAVGIVGGFGLIIFYITKGGLGLGDVKLLACLGIYVGFWKLLNLLLLATILSGLMGLILLVVGRVNKKTVMPFAPFVFISSLLILLVE